MIATLVNCAAVIVGALLGLLLHRRIRDSFRAIVYTGAGLVSLVLGMKMAFATTRIVSLALALIVGGMLGEWWKIEDGILRFGELLKRRFSREDDGRDFGYGFLNASVLFCVGAMALVGSFRAGAEGNYELILTKSVLDGFMAIMMTAAMGVGVAFSALTVLVYQGGLTLAAVWLKPLVNEAVLSEITGIGGVLVIMVGINLLGLKQLKTANFLPAILLVLALLALEPLLPVLGG